MYGFGNIHYPWVLIIITRYIVRFSLDGSTYPSTAYFILLISKFVVCCLNDINTYQIQHVKFFGFMYFLDSLIVVDPHHRER